MIDPTLVRILLDSALGALLGIAFFSALDWNVRLYVDGGGGWSAPFVHLIRLLVIGAVFTLCAHRGALPLLSILTGFQMIRMVAVNKRRIAIGRNA